MINKIEIPNAKKDVRKMLSNFTDQQMFEFCEYGLKKGLYLETLNLYNDELELRMMKMFGSNIVMVRC